MRDIVGPAAKGHEQQDDDPQNRVKETATLLRCLYDRLWGGHTPGREDLVVGRMHRGRMTVSNTRYRWHWCSGGWPELDSILVCGSGLRWNRCRGNGKLQGGWSWQGSDRGVGGEG